MNPHTLDAALRAAGAAVLATDLVMRKFRQDGVLRRCVHPATTPAARGRWASASSTTSRSAATHALAEHGLERVAVIDFDVHHGNGTEDIFEGDRAGADGFDLPAPVLSLQRHRGSGVQHGQRAARRAARGARELREAVTRGLAAGAERFPPELILFSAGFDAHVEDDMAMLRFVDSDYAWVTRQVKAVADRHAEGRIVSVLEGGYSLSALGRSARRSTCACSPASPRIGDCRPAPERDRRRRSAGRWA